MAHPAYYPKQTYFYPIGNTPPVSLTQHLPQEEPADILLLGCGDPRNILYTIATDASIGERSFDITCCDWEPVTLARNVILLTVISESTTEEWDTLWDIFYHLYIDENSLRLLASQSQKLIEASADLSTWNVSPYASFIRFCSSATLQSLRHHWGEFRRLSTLPISERLKLKLKMDAEFLAARRPSYDNNSTGVRNAGPMFASALPDAINHFKYYWENGVVASSSDISNTSMFPNPSLSYSSLGAGFALHYGTNPLLGFHLAPALAPIKPKQQSSADPLVTLTLRAKSQFAQWCKAFRRTTSAAVQGYKASSILIRFQVSEALAFGHALHVQHLGLGPDAGPFRSWWGSDRIVLDDEAYHHPAADATKRAPTTFNVIDTSNLTDHLGLMNVLVTLSARLTSAPWSIIMTETLLTSGESECFSLETRTFTDVRNTAFLLGLIPESCERMFTSRSSGHESLSRGEYHTSSQHHALVAWKRVPSDQDTAHVGVNPRQLSLLLFDIYLKMFDGENMMAGFAAMFRSPESALKHIKAQSVKHYMRRSFALLVHKVMDHVSTDWLAVMKQFFALVEEDHTLLMGMNSYQDLCTQLHILGVYSVATLLPDYEPESHPFATPYNPLGPFKDWPYIPPVVCVTLCVPRQRLDPLSKPDLAAIGTPLLEASTLQGDGSHSIYSHIQVMFGACRKSGPEHDPVVVVDEDPAGWKGSSPLAVSFWAPSWILRRPTRTSISLSLNDGQQAACRPLFNKLGPGLSLFSADLTSEFVYISRGRPNFPRELAILAKTFPSKDVSASENGDIRLTVELDDETRKPCLLKMRIVITDPKAKASLQSGATLFVTQVAPYTVSITFKNYRRSIHFPVPVDGRHLKTRIARKSLYIEVHAPPSTFDIPASRYDHFSPILTTSYPALSCISRLKLDSMPIVDTEGTGSKRSLTELVAHTIMAFSDHEMGEVTSGWRESDNTLSQVKGTIKLLTTAFCACSGQAERSTVFGLTLDRSRPGYALIFVQDMRLDLASHTITLDACVLPMTRGIIPGILRDLRDIGRKSVKMIITPPHEMRAWKELLPSFAERCRTWSHTPKCEYALKGTIPRSVQVDDNPLCSCGEGKGLGRFIDEHPYPALVPYLTRIAISQLFAVSYLEPVGNRVKETMLEDAHISALFERTCHQCHGPGKPMLQLCGTCKKVKYCSKECQKEAWKAHKKSCQK
ncbi:hypothetical protein HGRIS_010271 [Hohenbuehelia grisea]|uniref:MYND-type domain-containing protein n=1 Tax=Hohenbuehelia grisea TaxID=104357 RepID=A0ABR3J3Z5_9AGAR